MCVENKEIDMGRERNKDGKVNMRKKSMQDERKTVFERGYKRERWIERRTFHNGWN